MIASLAPALLPLGALAHWDALNSTQTGDYSTIACRRYGLIATGGGHSGGGRAPGSIMVNSNYYLGKIALHKDDLRNFRVLNYLR